ncbi:MAG: exosortase-associated EpsI family protein, partial [Planctomycetota bacterium]
MVRSYLPIIVTVVLVIVATVVEARFSDRFTETYIDAEEFGRRFADVPMDVGDWKGEDAAVDDEVLKTAGAVRHVNRVYTNSQTGQSVGVWLIVGHARDVCRHTPNICYPNQGFRQLGRPLKHVVSVPGEKDA